MSAPHWAGRYVGIPFLKDGHSRAGCNCWGLVHLVLQAELGIATPTYAEISAGELLAAARAFKNAVATDPWVKVEPPLREFDCVLMTALTDDGRTRLDGHVGVLVDPFTVLHVWAATDAVLMPLTHPRIRHKIIGYYRHRALHDASR